MAADSFEVGATDDTLRLTAQIISAYVATHVVATDQMPDLIRDVYQSLTSLKVPEHEPSVPAVPLRRSVFSDHLVCLEDGLPMKMLKRHLLTVHQLSPSDYRTKWGLPPDYPMVAPEYAKVRSELAKQSGLGKKPEERMRKPMARAAGGSALTRGPTPSRWAGALPGLHRSCCPRTARS